MRTIIMQSLLNRKGKFLLIAIQFFAGLTALMIGLYFLEGCFLYKRNLENIMSLDTVHVSSFEGAADETNADLLKRIHKKCNEKGSKMTYYHALDYSGDSFDDSCESQNRLFVAGGDFFEVIRNHFPEKTVSSFVSYSGRKEVPVIIGSALADSYAEGEVYDFPDAPFEGLSKHKMRIMGVIPSDQVLPLGGSSTIGRSVSTEGELDNTIILPEVPCLDQYFNDIDFLFQGDRAELEKLVQSNGEDMRIESLNEEVDRYNESQKTVILGALAFALVLLLLSMAGCIGTLLSMVLSRKEEFGIYVSLGMTKKHLIRILLGETGIVFIVSYIMAVSAFFSIIYLIEDIEKFVPWISLVVSFACSLVCMIVSVTVPVRRMAEWKPVELLYKNRR